MAGRGKESLKATAISLGRAIVLLARRLMANRELRFEERLVEARQQIYLRFRQYI